MRLCRLLSLFCLALVFASAVSARAASPYDKVVVESAATSIYIGKVTLLLSPLTRKDGVYSGDYRAKVFPYFFMNLSTRPAESTSFFLPLKNGWHLEQISTRIFGLVEWV